MVHSETLVGYTHEGKKMVFVSASATDGEESAVVVNDLAMVTDVMPLAQLGPAVVVSAIESAGNVVTFTTATATAATVLGFIAIGV